jgi:chemotaxis protein MotA
MKSILNKDLRQTVIRHTIGKKIFKGMGDSAPAFGMIGTLIGLVQMLSSMSDPRSIGPAMAVALLTTLYGAIIANFICNPLADKLGLRSQQELETKSIIIEGCIGISRGLSPTILEDSLRIHLAPKVRQKLEAAKAT